MGVLDWNDEPATEALSPLNFPTVRSNQVQAEGPIDPQSFLREDHHGFYGRPWVLGRYHFDELVRHGLARTDHVLDFGCGAGRVGVWLIRYLKREHYCGIDAHLRALRAFAEYECPLHDLLRKRPRLLHSDTFDVDRFGVTFDVILDFFTTPHLSEGQAVEAMSRVAKVSAPGARLFSTKPRLNDEAMCSVGFTPVETFMTDYPLLAGHVAQPDDTWRVYSRAGA